MELLRGLAQRPKPTTQKTRRAADTDTVACEVALHDGRVGVIRVIGHHSTEEAAAACAQLERWARDLGTFRLVADGQLMTGYESEARQAYTGLLKIITSHVDEMAIVGLGPIFRMAATAICLYAGIRMRFYGSVEEAIGASSASRRAS